MKLAEMMKTLRAATVECYDARTVTDRAPRIDWSEKDAMFVVTTGFCKSDRLQSVIEGRGATPEIAVGILVANVLHELRAELDITRDAARRKIDAQMGAIERLEALAREIPVR
jgi:hypothetical protein